MNAFNRLFVLKKKKKTIKKTIQVSNPAAYGNTMFEKKTIFLSFHKISKLPTKITCSVISQQFQK